MTPSIKEASACGTWLSDITAEQVAAIGEGASTARMFELQVDRDNLFYLSSRPDEAGRNTIFRYLPGKDPEMVLPEPWNARTRVHEYGGASYVVNNGNIWFSQDSDSRVYYLQPGKRPEALTPIGPYRFADFILDSYRNRLICVRENHGSVGEAHNEIVSIDVGNGEMTALFAAADFVAAPSLSPDGTELVWLSWNHPNMPWDDVDLCRAKLKKDGTLDQIYKEESQSMQARMQPQWCANGNLYYLSDRDGWWNLYLWLSGEEEGRQITFYKAEIGEPSWHLGNRHYEILDDNTALVSYSLDGVWYAAQICLESGKELVVSEGWGKITTVRKIKEQCYLLAADTIGSSGIYIWNNGYLKPTLTLEKKIPVDEVSIAQRLCVPLPITEVTSSNEFTHAFYYPPLNKNYEALPDERPPVIVNFHGGPTWQSSSNFSLKRQFWTSRGYALIDVNYRGSSGYGRSYRQRLYEQWGVVDVEDAAAVLKFAEQEGLVDVERAVITGASAGGFTVLSCLTCSNAFAAGVNIYGVSDLKTMVLDTHKFESRYIKKLASISTYKDGEAIYRSPINSSKSINVPLLTLQGAEDKVVPPSQSRDIINAVNNRGLPYAYIEFKDEQHGFRKTETIKRALEAELSFYLQIFGLKHPDDIEPIIIENLI